MGYVDSAEISGAVSVLVTNTVVAAKHQGRQEITVVNDHATQVVYLALSTTPDVAPTAVANSGIRLNPGGGTWTSHVYRGAVAGISVGGTSVVTIVDI